MRTSTRRVKKRPLLEEYPSSVSVEYVSISRKQDGRIAKKRVIERSNVDSHPPPTPSPGFIPYDPLSDVHFPQAQAAETKHVERTAASVSRAVSAKLAEWIPHRQETLSEFLRLEAPPSTTPLCFECQEPAVYRCLGCYSGEMTCQGCLVSSHSRVPLHPVEKWNGRFFEETTLTALGLIIKLGHRHGDMCPNPSRLRDLMVFDLSGVHRIVVQYCACGGLGESVPKRTQLIRARWFPATIHLPSTVFSFNLLDFFHKLQNRNKCNPYDFYHTIIQRTDAAGLDPEIHRYNEITLVFRIWSPLQLLKRGGSICSSTVTSAPEGSAAIICPACPHPGKNTTTFPESDLWKNTLFLGIDACFKLKQKERGFKDPDLGTGLSYMVNDISYAKFLASNVGTPETISTCGPDLHAVNEAYTKYSHGYAVTGVAAVSCRHGFVRANGVVDLQKGEKYLNIDYALASTLAKDIKAGIKDVVITYDIGCQWGKNLHRRLSNYISIPSLDLSMLRSFRVGVPKFHLIGHGQSCQLGSNLALMDGVSMTHGESVETIWSHSTSLATWSRENGPAARHLILDDHWTGWNWSKVVNLRPQLKKQLERAWVGVEVQREVADSMSLTWSEFVPEWTKMWAAYKKDSSKPNPFQQPDPDVVLTGLKAELARADSEKRKAGTTFPHEVTPSLFIQKALDIEATQRRLKANNKDSDDSTEGSFHERRRTLSRNIRTIREPQRLYMKGVDPLLNQIDPVLLADHPENVDLWLPSNIPLPMRSDWCTLDLPELEYRLRHAMASNALQDIRRLRQFSQTLAAKTRSHISNTQSTVSRSRGQFGRVQQKIEEATATYRACRDAIMRLAPNEEFGQWKKILQELRRQDISGPAREGDEVSTSGYVPSWIWRTPHQGSASTYDQDFRSALRVEWCKAQARATRYEEEVQLVTEEMRRTLAFFNWFACDWEAKATTPAGYSGVDKRTLAGISSYAYKQVAIYRKLIAVFVSDWYKCLETKSLGSSWIHQYPRPPSTKRRRLVSNVRLHHPKPAPNKDDLNIVGSDSDSDSCSDSDDEGGMDELVSNDRDLFELAN